VEAVVSKSKDGLSGVLKLRFVMAGEVLLPQVSEILRCGGKAESSTATTAGNREEDRHYVGEQRQGSGQVQGSSFYWVSDPAVRGSPQ